MSRLRELGESIGSTVLDGIGRASSRVQERKPLPVDLLESEESYLAVFDAPGVEAADVQVRFEHGVLYVRIDRFREFYDDYEMRLPGRGMSLDGEVALPDNASVDPSRSTATVGANGTLRVELPKVDASAPASASDEGAVTDVAVGGGDDHAEAGADEAEDEAEEESEPTHTTAESDATEEAHDEE
jgi:HSP20 family molecular chaperone IbpA